MESTETPRRGAHISWGALAAALVLSACATKPPDAPPTAAPAVQTLEQTLKEAADAAAGGNREQARDLYRLAARAYPASKEPWLRLADDYMREDNHGHAVLAAQEVLQRDPADVHAAGILTVAGLRVAAAGIQTLRQHQVGGVDGESRTEAQKTAALLREITGEKEILPAPPAPAAEPAGASKPPARRPAPRPPVAAAAPAPAASRAPADNPFKPAR